ncbi:MAG: DUF547 domain-containing protein [Alphaproteobacteria bacterium]
MLTDRLEAFLAPRANLWPRWESHDPSSRETFDHGRWNEFLGRYVVTDGSGVNRIAYGRVRPDDKGLLEAYIDNLAGADAARLGRREQFAFWVNLYNALTVNLVLEHFPISSIRDIAGRTWPLLSFGPWKRKLCAVAGEPLSLSDIENRILRPIWRDPRIHYAVNCASVGCPNLRQEAFAGVGLEAQLESAAREFVNGPRCVIEHNGRLVVSSLYNWYARDFGSGPTAVLDHISQYARTSLVNVLEGARRIDGYEYDWRLNVLGEADTGELR